MTGKLSQLHAETYVDFGSSQLIESPILKKKKKDYRNTQWDISNRLGKKFLHFDDLKFQLNYAKLAISTTVHRED